MDAILAFHALDDSGSVLSYPPADFERLVDGLLAEGAAIVPLGDLVKAAPDARPRVALTFDDGMRSVHARALPILAARRLPATVFVVSEFVGRDNRWPSQPAGIARFELMTWSELAELRAAGIELGGHTATHIHLRNLRDEEWTRELVDSKRRIEDELAFKIRHFAYPYGTVGAEAASRVAREYELAVTTRMAFLRGPAGAADDVHHLPRLDSWYLQPVARRLPLFGIRSRAWLGARALLRRLKGAVGGGAGYGA